MFHSRSRKSEYRSITRATGSLVWLFWLPYQFRYQILLSIVILIKFQSCLKFKIFRRSRHLKLGTDFLLIVALQQLCGNSSGSGGGEKHEICAVTFGGHLFYDLFSQGQGGHGPLAPWIRYWVTKIKFYPTILWMSQLTLQTFRHEMHFLQHIDAV